VKENQQINNNLFEVLFANQGEENMLKKSLELEMQLLES